MTNGSGPHPKRGGKKKAARPAGKPKPAADLMKKAVKRGGGPAAGGK